MNWPNPDYDGKATSGKEVILRINSKNIKNKNIFYTDANGYHMIERINSYKEDYEADRRSDVIPGNFFPMNSAIYIEDRKSGLRLT